MSETINQKYLKDASGNKISPVVFYESIYDENGNSAKEQIEEAVQGNIETKGYVGIPDEYDSTHSYAVGDYCVHNNIMYRCTGSTTGSWDSTKWTATTVMNEIGSGSSEVNTSVSIPDYDKKPTTWVAGGNAGSINLNRIAYGNNIFVAVGNNGVNYHSTDGKSWTAGSSTGSNVLWDVIYANGMFVAVGVNGVNYHSEDGINWTAGTTTGVKTLYGIAYGNDLFVAVAADGFNYYSSDGSTWTAGTQAGSDHLFSVTYGNGKFVTIGASGACYYSTDGSTWTIGSGINGEYLYRVAYGNSMFVAVGVSGVNYHSADGITWIAGTAFSSDGLNGITFANNTFVTVGDNGVNYYSVDGLTWTAGNSTGNTLNSVVYGKGKFITVGNSGKNYYSIVSDSTSLDDLGEIINDNIEAINKVGIPDEYDPTRSYGVADYCIYCNVLYRCKTSTTGLFNPAHWESTTVMNEISRGARKMVYDNGNNLYAGDSTSPIYFSNGKPYSTTIPTYIADPSKMPTTWSSGNRPYYDNSKHLNAITYGKNSYGEGHFIAVGEDKNFYDSTTGTSWTKCNGTSSYTLNDVAYGNGVFVAVGSSGACYYTTNITFWSAASGTGSTYLNGITYGDGKFVAVGESGNTFYSTDGSAWTKNTVISSGGTLQDVAYGNGVYVTVGNSGKNYYSTNGTTWTAGGSAGSTNLYGITYANDMFIAVGGSGVNYHSTDGKTWTAGTTVSGASFSDITYGNGMFAASATSGYNYYSADGSTWTAGSNSVYLCNGITYGNGLFIAVGYGGYNYYSSVRNSRGIAKIGQDINEINEKVYENTRAISSLNNSLPKFVDIQLSSTVTSTNIPSFNTGNPAIVYNNPLSLPSGATIKSISMFTNNNAGWVSYACGISNGYLIIRARSLGGQTAISLADVTARIWYE